MNSTVFRACAPDLQQLGLHVLARLRVERGERLVHQQHDRIRRQRPRQVDPLLHAAGQLRRIVALESGEADQLHEMLGALAHRRRRRTASASPCRSGRCRRWCARAAGWSAGRRRRDRRRARRSRVPSMVTVPIVVGQQPGDDVEQRGLAAAARSDDGDELAVGDRQRHVGQRQNLPAVALDVVALGEAGRSRA